ncbi:NACHT domain-containing protein [Azotobacter chroococcum]|uniref:NACHT domain-containing protein n=1 Tax=Azotobacter chroococcum TaxID=353 RepID=A0AA43Z9M0_9GAMM|nr:NACHT domain-containing protein [Azotobacter chroococcum]NHN78593.1 NACHT domain-containing protein [Azotobacter chroococcum]
MPTNWKSLEDHVRGIAQLRWSAPCIPEHINGVDFDGVVRVSADEIILIEITKERNLDKVRADISKILPTKITLATQGIICRAFVVLDEEPTPSMIEAGKTAHIAVTSKKKFERDFFDFESYDRLRNTQPFGSAVDSKTGENDPRNFIPVKYIESTKKENITIDRIVARLMRGAKVILTGDYGTGKSRCVREIYSSLAQRLNDAGAFPIAINLRDHWSSSNALEIIAGHLGNIGLSNSIDNIIRLLNSGHLILLLDGFDEIGAQSYDARVEDRKALRKHAVRGVRDLITKTKAGILVTGRSHFFDSDEEMLQSLGCNSTRDEILIISAPESFSMEEGQQYLKALNIDVPLPPWLPRKPLVFQVIVELARDEITNVLSRNHGEFEFWCAFINAVCIRESRGVADSIAPMTIKLLLLDLAGKSRYSDQFLGRLNPRDIDDSYEKVVGTAPDQTGRQLLARMCALGRIEPESPDRQFVDYNVVDVLRAEQLMHEVAALSEKDTNRQWKQSLQFMGAIHAAALVHALDLNQLCFTYLNKFGNSANTKKIGEIISAMTTFSTEQLDFHGALILNSEIPFLNLSKCTFKNITIRDSIINLLALNNTKLTTNHNLNIENSLITVASGVSDSSGLPAWIKGTEVIHFQSISNSARIKETPLLPQQKLLLSIIHKIFFQPGSGREESALLKGGYGQKYNPKLVDGIIKILLREGIIERFKGRDGWVYTPVRRFTELMSKIRSELTICEEAIWKEVSNLRE